MSPNSAVKKKRKDDDIHIRVEPATKVLIKQAAELQGLDISSYMTRLAVVAARESLSKVEHLELSQRDGETFMNMLENPPVPNESLKRAFAEYKNKKLSSK